MERGMLNPAAGSVGANAAPESLDAELDGYNYAFCKLELPWRWDAGTMRQLQSLAPDGDFVGAYVERHQSHLLRVYDKGFLRELVLAAKARHRQDSPRAAR
jgi:hypothetical protein